MSGYIYCFSNDTIDDVYKIGRTKRDPIIRLTEANCCGTWNIIQSNYKFEFAKKVDDCCEMERKIHDILESIDSRVYPNREFFKISLITIKKIFDIISGEWYNPENCGDYKNNIVTLPETPQEISQEALSETLENTLLDTNDRYKFDENGLTCAKCSKIYSSLLSYNNHIRLNRCKIKINEMVCNYCNKNFKSKQGRQKHEINCKTTHDAEIKKLNDKINNIELLVKRRN
jgi:hypothetical protein